MTERSQSLRLSISILRASKKLKKDRLKSRSFFASQKSVRTMRYERFFMRTSRCDLFCFYAGSLCQDVPDVERKFYDVICHCDFLLSIFCVFLCCVYIITHRTLQQPCRFLTFYKKCKNVFSVSPVTVY